MSNTASMTGRQLIARLLETNLDLPVKFYTKPEGQMDDEEGIVLNDDTTVEVVDVTSTTGEILLGCETFDEEV